MFTCEKNITPFLVPQVKYCPATPENLRDVSMCVALALGWSFEQRADPATGLNSVYVISDDGTAWLDKMSEPEDVLFKLYRRDDIPHYAHNLDAIFGSLADLWSDMSAHFHNLPSRNSDPALVHATISTRFHHVDSRRTRGFLTADVQGRPHTYSAIADQHAPALALALAYLQFDPKRIEIR